MLEKKQTTAVQEGLDLVGWEYWLAAPVRDLSVFLTQTVKNKKAKLRSVCFWPLAICHYCWLQSRFLLLEDLIVIKLLPLCLFKRFSALNCFDRQQFGPKRLVREWDVKSTCGMRRRHPCYCEVLLLVYRNVGEFHESRPLSCTILPDLALRSQGDFVTVDLVPGSP